MAGRWKLGAGRFLLFLGLCLPANALLAQVGSRLWRPDERVVLRDFGHIRAVAASNAGVFAATTGGLIVYDARAKSWLPPVTAMDGYPVDSVFAALADPADQSLWLATANGVVHYLPVLRRFESVPLPGGVDRLMFDADNPFRGVFVRARAAGEWRFLPRGGLTLEPPADLPPPDRWVTPLTLAEAGQRFPATQAMGDLSQLDQRLRRVRYTAVAIEPVTRLVLFGTSGAGLVAYDPPVATFERLPFGLPADGVGALTEVAGQVWVGTTGRDRSGFTLVSPDIQNFLFEEGPGGTGYEFDAVRDLGFWSGELWAATDRGALRIVGESAQWLDDGAGLPAWDAYAVARTETGTWIGTAAGIVLIPAGSASLITVGKGVPVRTMAVHGDSLWVGGETGLGVVPWRTGPTELQRPAAVARQPLLEQPLVAIEPAGNRLVAATADRILWRGEAPGWNPEIPLSGQVGQIVGLAGDDAAGGVWVAGTQAVTFFRFATRSFQPVTGAGDLPAPVTAVAVTDRYLWVGTGRGLVRFAKSALLP